MIYIEVRLLTAEIIFNIYLFKAQSILGILIKQNLKV